MPKRRIVAALVAALLTVVAAVLLLSYVAGADRRAAAALEPAPVLVVVEPVARGTAAESLGVSVEVREVPSSAIAEDAVSDVADLAGRVAAIDLVPGEQVLAARFVDPSDLQSAQVPAGLQEVSIQLNAERVYGGRPAAGDTVGVFVTDTDARTTKAVVNNVLVTRVQGGLQAPTPTAANAEEETTSAPEATILLTLALDTPDAELVVWGKENGGVWLSLQNDDTTTSGSRAVTPENFIQ